MNTKAAPRDEFRFRIAKAVDEAVTMTGGNNKSCLNCSHFDEKAELCVKFQQRPPARVIAFACPEYEDCDEIPF